MELRKINFFPVKLTLDDIYALETILNEYFGNCMIKAGCKKFESADELLSYLRKKSITSYFMQQYCFRKIIFKSTEQEVFQIMLLRSNTIIELPENAIKEGLYKKLIDYLEQRADRTLF